MLIKSCLTVFHSFCKVIVYFSTRLSKVHSISFAIRYLATQRPCIIRHQHLRSSRLFQFSVYIVIQRRTTFWKALYSHDPRRICREPIDPTITVLICPLSSWRGQIATSIFRVSWLNAIAHQKILHPWFKLNVFLLNFIFYAF